MRVLGPKAIEQLKADHRKLTKLRPGTGWRSGRTQLRGQHAASGDCRVAHGTQQQQRGRPRNACVLCSR